jgi:hypothetical protein
MKLFWLKPSLRKISDLFAILSICLAVNIAQAFPPVDAVEKKWYSGIKVDGSLQTTLGIDEPNVGSIFASKDTRSQVDFSTRRFNALLRVRQPGKFLALFDGMLENDQDTGQDLHQGLVNQLYLAYDVTDVLRVRVGKQRTLWGHGFAYIPTDFINPPLDPTALNLIRPGVKAISFDYSFSKFTLSGILTKDSGKVIGGEGLKLTSSAISGLDFYLIYYHSDIVGHAGGASFAVDPSVIWFPKWPSFVIYGSLGINEKSRYPEVLNATYTVNGSNLYYPAVGPTGKTGPYLSFLAAMSYEFVKARLSLSAEYYYIGDAYPPGDRDKIMNALSSPNIYVSQPSSLWLNNLTAFGRNQQQYLSLSLSHRSVTEGVNHFLDTFGYELGLLQGLNDSSNFMTAAIKSNYWSNTEITLRSFQPFGNSKSEFGSMPFNWNLQLLVKVGF